MNRFKKEMRKANPHGFAFHAVRAQIAMNEGDTFSARTRFDFNATEPARGERGRITAQSPEADAVSR